MNRFPIRPSLTRRIRNNTSLSRSIVSTWFTQAPSILRHSFSSSSNPKLDLAHRPFRIAIVGGGPAGFYSAARLLSLPGSDQLKIDLFEHLPTPFGLARFGVAPDHPEVKNCSHKFIETAQDPRFTYYGNVQISGETPTPTSSSATSDSSSTTTTTTTTIVPNLSPSPLAYQLPLSTLRPHYDAIILSYGSSLDRSLGGLPGEDTLSGIESARDFVNWYNGHPLSTLSAPTLALDRTHHVSIIGQGNVALDCARILLKDVDELKPFDVPEPVLAELAKSKVRTVEIVGRRGLLQLAGTTKELRELIQLQPRVGFGIDSELLQQTQVDLDRLGKGWDGYRAKKRALDLMTKTLSTKLGGPGAPPPPPAAATRREWSLQFLRSPKAFHPRQGAAAPSSNTFDRMINHPQRVGSIEYKLNQLVPNSTTSNDPSLYRTEPTGQTLTVETDLVLKSIGYRSIGLPGLPFDSRRGVLSNRQGRITLNEGPDAATKEQRDLKGLYVAGWLGRGPTGVIATTMFEAFQLADTVAHDLVSSRSTPNSSTTTTQEDESPKRGIRLNLVEGGRRIVGWKDWETIDEKEKQRGKALGKEREKFTTVKEMLDLL